MDKTLLKNRFAKAAQTYQDNALAQERISLKMIDLLKKHTDGAFSQIYEFGCGTGIYSRLLKKEFNPAQLILNDLCGEMQHRCIDLTENDTSVIFSVGDAEKTTLPNRLNLLTSCSTLQWFQSPINYLKRCESSLVENGIIAFSTFGQDNLKEIFSLTQTGLKYLTRDELVEELSGTYHIIYSEEERFSLTFSRPIDILYHLKKTGVNGVTNHRFTKTTLQHFIDKYESFKTPDGQYRLTYHPIYILLQKNKITNR